MNVEKFFENNAQSFSFNDFVHACASLSETGLDNVFGQLKQKIKLLQLDDHRQSQLQHSRFPVPFLLQCMDRGYCRAKDLLQLLSLSKKESDTRIWLILQYMRVSLYCAGQLFNPDTPLGRLFDSIEYVKSYHTYKCCKKSECLREKYLYPAKMKSLICHPHCSGVIINPLIANFARHERLRILELRFYFDVWVDLDYPRKLDSLKLYFQASINSEQKVLQKSGPKVLEIFYNFKSSSPVFDFSNVWRTKKVTLRACDAKVYERACKRLPKTTRELHIFFPPGCYVQLKIDRSRLPKSLKKIHINGRDKSDFYLGQPKD